MNLYRIFAISNGKAYNHTEKEEVFSIVATQDFDWGATDWGDEYPCGVSEYSTRELEVTIQSLFPFIKTSVVVMVEEGVDNVLEFEDKEKY